MIWDVLFGTFCCQWHIVSKTFNYLLRSSYSFKGGTVHMNQFGERNLPIEVQVWPLLN